MNKTAERLQETPNLARSLDKEALWQGWSLGLRFRVSIGLETLLVIMVAASP